MAFYSFCAVLLVLAPLWWCGVQCLPARGCNPRRAGVPIKKTAFMSATELALTANLSVGDLIEEKIFSKLDNGTVIELPLLHKAIVVDADALQVVHYRYKDENDTTAEERAKAKALEEMTQKGANDQRIGEMVDCVVRKAKQDFRDASSLSDLQNVRIDCRGCIRDGVMDLLHQYSAGQRKVYQDNMVRSINLPCRVNNELDRCWQPSSDDEIVRRAKSRIGEERFRLEDHNCETFANWARYDKNYTEQGARIGGVVQQGISDFEAMCARANAELVNKVAGEISTIKDKTLAGVGTGAVAGGTIGLVACVIFPPGCLVAVPTIVVTASVANAQWNFVDAKDKALDEADAWMRAKMGVYKQEFVRIVRNLMIGLKIDKIAQVDA